jgi:hypothetical protein
MTVVISLPVVNKDDKEQKDQEQKAANNSTQNQVQLCV